MVENPGASSFDELFLYSTGDLLTGEWEPHPLNPIVSDVRRSRPAGRIFEQDGRLYRPAQNCAGRYGSGIVLNRIDILSRTDYAESPITSFDARFAEGIGSMHTFNVVEELTMADARISRWIWW